MANVFGADVQALTDLASSFEQAASQLSATRQSVGAKVQQSAWVGPIADRFRSDWSSTNNSKLASSAQLLSSAAATLRKNAAEQAQASSASGGAGSGAHPALVISPETGPGIAYGLAKVGSYGEGLISDGHDLYQVLTAGKSFTSIAKFADDLGNAKILPILSVVGMGFSANDLGAAIGKGDQGAILGSSLDLIAGGVGVVVPGAGLAWETGKAIGTGIYDGVQTFWNTPESANAEALREMYGPNVDVNHPTLDQTTGVTDRYNGPLGIYYSVHDSINGGVHDFFNWVSGGTLDLVAN